jgi:hypothetical protein
MSLMTVAHTMDRIKGAIPSSPIAVFRCDKKGEVNAVFADTVKTRQQIADKDPGLIGVYDSSMNLSEIERTLTRIAG